MTVPGGDSGEKAQNHTGEPQLPPSQPGQHPPSETPPEFAQPSGPPPAGYPPPAYPLPGYPPPSYPPPGYQTAPGYGPYPQAPPESGGSEGGYGQPPVEGYPVPDYAGGYGRQSGTNTLAIVSLIASCLGLLCGGISAVVGIVLGAVALNQIKQTREEGYGLAVAGIVIGVAVLLIYLVVVVVQLR